jgi:hypothetical protein
MNSHFDMVWHEWTIIFDETLVENKTALLKNEWSTPTQNRTSTYNLYPSWVWWINTAVGFVIYLFIKDSEHIELPVTWHNETSRFL